MVDNLEKNSLISALKNHINPDKIYPDILYIKEKKPILIIFGNNSVEIAKKLEKIEKIIKNP